MPTDELGLRLHYADPLRPCIDADEVIRRGRRVRSLRRTVGGVAVIAAVVGVGASVRGGHAGSDPAALVAAVADQPAARAHPPVEQPVLLSNAMAGWHPVAWLSSGSVACEGVVASKRDAGASAPLTSLVCQPLTAPAVSVGRQVLGVPAFVALPPPQETGGRVVGIGFVRGADLDSVRVTFRGGVFSAPVTRIGSLDAQSLSAYGVWLPVRGLSTYGSSDISSVVALDRAGRVVAALLDRPTKKAAP